MVFSSSSVGLFRFGTSGSLQAAMVTRVTAAARKRIVFMIGPPRSEVDVERQEIAARRREWRHVLVARDVLVSKVAHFGIEPLVFGPGEKIAPAQLDRRIVGAS